MSWYKDLVKTEVVDWVVTSDENIKQQGTLASFLVSGSTFHDGNSGWASKVQNGSISAMFPDFNSFRKLSLGCLHYQKGTAQMFLWSHSHKWAECVCSQMVPGKRPEQTTQSKGKFLPVLLPPAPRPLKWIDSVSSLEATAINPGESPGTERLITQKIVQGGISLLGRAS